MAVISDASHTFSAVSGVLVALVAARIARGPADDRKSFGWFRAELIGALVNGAFLLVMAILVIGMGAMRLGNPIHLPTGPMLWMAAGGILTEVISIALLYKQQSSDLNVRGVYWHILQTFVGSLIIIVAALIIEFTGFLDIDPLLGMAFGFVLLWASWGILADATHLLMDGTPGDIDLPTIASRMSELGGVKVVHHVHGWALTSGRCVFSAHIRVGDGDGDEQSMLEAAHKVLKEEFGFYFSTIQIEKRCLDERAVAEIDQAFDPKSGAQTPVG